MRQRLKPELDLEVVQENLVQKVCAAYTPGVSVRSLAKSLEMSPMKVRKILITGGCYATDLSTEIEELYRDGKTVGEIAMLMNMTPANVNAYLPYEKIIYNMEEKSPDADRHERYRERKKAGAETVKTELPKIERVRNKTLVIVIGKKLRSLLPKDLLDNSTDPLSRDFLDWGPDPWNPKDPGKMIWCAEITASGRGRDKRQAIVLESANSGFAVICSMPSLPIVVSNEELENMLPDIRREAALENRQKILDCRRELEQEMIDAIRSGFLTFSLPEEKVQDYVDSIARVELVRGKPSAPATRLDELIQLELVWERGQDPLESFNVRGNFTSRKFGNSPLYRNVQDAVFEMLNMDDEERNRWTDTFIGTMTKNLGRQ